MLNSWGKTRWYEARAIYRRHASWCTPRGKHVCSLAWLRPRHQDRWSCKCHNSPQPNNLRKVRSRHIIRCEWRYTPYLGKAGIVFHLWTHSICGHKDETCCNICSSFRYILANGTRQQKPHLDWWTALWEVPNRIGTWERLGDSLPLHSPCQCDRAPSCS